MKMPKKTQRLMQEYAQTLPPSTTRAQCNTIANYYLHDETIAERINRDHVNESHAKRAMTLMVKAGCATEKGAKDEWSYGVFTFEDGSTF